MVFNPPSPQVPLRPLGEAGLLMLKGKMMHTSVRDAVWVECAIALWIHSCLKSGVKPQEAARTDKPLFRHIKKVWDGQVNEMRVLVAFGGLTSMEEIAVRAAKTYEKALAARAVKDCPSQPELSLLAVS